GLFAIVFLLQLRFIFRIDGASFYFESVISAVKRRFGSFPAFELRHSEEAIILYSAYPSWNL
ncbi:hypothetical protein, partial [uncultured Paenibacillus sp.]|uniref:hypothetical protein n=1 Tax=uncultured Paenibacillus sp. TaxID=227322 RepID=UPI0028D5CD1F